MPDQDPAAVRLREDTVEALRRQLAESGMTQRQVADACGITEARISHIFNNPSHNNLTLETIARVAAAMGCHVGVVIEPVAAEVAVPTQVRRSRGDCVEA